jgi:hypothetical protein
MPTALSLTDTNLPIGKLPVDGDCTAGGSVSVIVGISVITAAGVSLGRSIGISAGASVNTGASTGPDVGCAMLTGAAGLQAASRTMIRTSTIKKGLLCFIVYFSSDRMDLRCLRSGLVA